MVFRLENAIQPYAWGSPDALGELFGLENRAGAPMAEVWMGAHPKAPSALVDGAERIPLDRYIAEDPVSALGAQAVARFGNRLPFLFKLLAAAEPLSIQAHPDLDQARRGFAREEAARIPRDAPQRNYRDDNHKPELIYALTNFWAMRGFRSPDEIRAEFTAAVSPPEGLSLPRVEGDIATFFRTLMILPDDGRRALVDAAVRHAHERCPSSTPEPDDPDARYCWLLRIAEKYPDDAGVLAPLFLNVLCLRPGEATYQPAGVLHAYLEGVGAELMANSDNVLRGGLTPKHIDVDELLAVGGFRTEPTRVLTGEERKLDGTACSIRDYPAPFDEFAFSTITCRGTVSIAPPRPQILFCAAGELTIEADTGVVALRRGESAFVAAAAGAARVTGIGEALRATVGIA